MTTPEGIAVYRGAVLAQWIDANAHMNVAWYGFIFDQAVDALWAQIGHDEAYRRQHPSTTFAVEAHTRYLREILEGEAFVVRTRVVGLDEKRIHQWQMLVAQADDRLIATCEWLHLHVSRTTRRVCPWPDTIYRPLAALRRDDEQWPRPDGLSASIKLKRKTV